MKRKKVIYCPDCGKENVPEAVLCRECGKAINEVEQPFRDFLKKHIKDELKGKLGDKVFDAVKGWLLSHLYASVVTVTVIAAAATGISASAKKVHSEKTSERPAPVAELEFLSSEEQALFEENNDHEIFGAEEYENVWLPAVMEHTLLTEKNSCYGWVIVRDAELRAETLFDGYSEIYVCPGVTVTVNGVLKEKEGFVDFYVAPGGTLIINGDIKGGANICNDGTTIVNGNYDGGKAQITCNRGDIRVTGAYSGGLELYTFRGATVTGEDRTNSGIHYYDIDASDLYQGVTGMNGMFIAAGMLSEGTE